jgi:hypothetical protein
MAAPSVEGPDYISQVGPAPCGRAQRRRGGASDPTLRLDYTNTGATTKVVQLS